MMIGLFFWGLITLFFAPPLGMILIGLSVIGTFLNVVGALASVPGAVQKTVYAGLRRDEERKLRVARRESIDWRRAWANFKVSKIAAILKMIGEELLRFILIVVLTIATLAILMLIHHAITT